MTVTKDVLKIISKFFDTTGFRVLCVYQHVYHTFAPI